MRKKAKKDTASSTDAASRRNGVDKPRTGIKAIETVATLKELRKATQHTQDDLAISMGVGQGAISRLEKRQDMLVSTLAHYVEGIGGKLQILATFPDRPPLIVERLGKKTGKSPSGPEQEPTKPSSGPGRKTGKLSGKKRAGAGSQASD